MSSDGSAAASIDSEVAARAPTEGERGDRGWLELWWQPVGEPRGGDDDGSGRRRRVPEFHVTDHRAAQVLSLVLAVVVAVGAVWWGVGAVSRFEVPSLACVGCVPPDWLRWLQLLVAFVGIAVAVVQICYFVSFAVRGVVWRRWNAVTIVLGSLAAGWTALQWIDRLWL